MIKSFRSSPLKRLGLLAFLLPGTCLMFWVGTRTFASGNDLASAAFILVGAILAIFLIFQCTMRVDMDERSLTRSWLLGRTTILMNDITRLGWGGGRGVLVLTITYGAKKFIQLSSNAVSEEELRDIHQDVLAKSLAAHGLEGAPLLPLFSESVGYVDIAAMIERGAGGGAQRDA